VSDNLYAPPSADLGTGVEPLLGGGDFTFGRCLSEAWERTWANFPLWLGAGIVFALAMAVSGLTIIGVPLVWPVLMWGSIVLTLHLYDGGAKVSDLFSGFSQYGRALATMLGVWLVSFVVAIVGQIPLMAAQAADSGIGIAIGQVVNLAFTLLVSPRLSFASYLIVERDMPLGAAISTSWARTAPVMWKLAGLILLMVPIMFAGVMALIVGIIPAMMIAYLMWTSAYRQIFGGAPQAAA
jgi:hypothetical protein